MALPSWAVPAIAGVALGYLFSNTLSGLVARTGLPIHSMAAQVRRPARPMIRPHPAAHQMPVHPAATYVPVRRSFDRSYDSWLQTTVNALPTIG